MSSSIEQQQQRIEAVEKKLASWQQTHDGSLSKHPKTPPFLIVMILLIAGLLAVIIAIIATARQPCKQGEPHHPPHDWVADQKVHSTSDTDTDTKGRPSIAPIAGSLCGSACDFTCFHIHELLFRPDEDGGHEEPDVFFLRGHGFTEDMELSVEYFGDDSRHPLPPPTRLRIQNASRHVDIKSVPSVVLTSKLVRVRDREMAMRVRSTVLQSEGEFDERGGCWGLRLQSTSTLDSTIFLKRTETSAQVAGTYRNALGFQETRFNALAGHWSQEQPSHKKVALVVSLLREEPGLDGSRFELYRWGKDENRYFEIKTNKPLVLRDGFFILEMNQQTQIVGDYRISSSVPTVWGHFNFSI